MQTPTQPPAGPIADGIRQLAAELKVPAAHLWSVLVRQARIEVVTDGIWAVLFGAGLWMCVRLFRLAGRKAAAEGSYDDTPYRMGQVGLVLVGCLFGILAGTCVTSMVSNLLNPEYFALKQILRAGK